MLCWALPPYRNTAVRWNDRTVCQTESCRKYTPGDVGHLRVPYVSRRVFSFGPSTARKTWRKGRNYDKIKKEILRHGGLNKDKGDGYMKKLLKEFETFIMRGNVIDMAVGVIVGAAFQGIVNSLVNDVISPLLGLVANTDLSYLAASVNGVEIRYGAFITAVINFLIMAFVIFLLVKLINKISGLGRGKKAPEAPAKPTTKICPYCKSEIPIDAVKCCHCTSDVE